MEAIADERWTPDPGAAWAAMKPAPFEYVAPTEALDVVRLLAADVDAKVIAGGQSLVPSMNMRLARPKRLVDISRVSGLDRIEREADGRLTIGATATQAVVADSAVVREGWPVIADAIAWIGHPQIRNRGTVCGNLAHHDPSSELPAVAVALDAIMTVLGPSGQRQVDAASFFVSTFETALDEAELLVAVSFPPLDPGIGWSVDEVTRRHGDFAIVGAVVLLRPGASGQVASSTVVLFGVGSRPFRSGAAEAILAGAAASEVTFAAAAAAAAGEIRPTSDIHASADDRRAMARAVVERALRTARERMR